MYNLNQGSTKTFESVFKWLVFLFLTIKIFLYFDQYLSAWFLPIVNLDQSYTRSAHFNPKKLDQKEKNKRKK